MDIVGTAHVRIRAITNDLEDDISEGLNRGVGGADSSGAGKKAGGDIGDGIADGIEGEAPNIERSIQRTVSRSDGSAEKRGNWLGRLIQRGMGKGLSDEERKFDAKFKQMLSKLQKGLDNFKMPGIGWTAIFGIPLLSNLITAAVGIIGTLIAQLGYLMTAAAATGAAMITAFAGVALGILPVMLAFKAETPALEAFKEAAADVGEEWQKVGIAAQKHLLPGLTAAMKTSTKLIPQFEQFSTVIGKIVGDTAKFGVATLTAERNSQPLNRVLMMSAQVMEQLGRAVIYLANGLLPFFAAASPLAERFAGSIEKMMENFSNFMRAGQESGELEAKLTVWYDRAELVGRAFVNIGKAIWNVLTVGAQSATPFFETLDKTAKRWEEFTSSTEGQQRIFEIFERMRPVMHEVNGLISDLIGWMLTPYKTDGGNSAVLGFLQTLRQDLLPALMTMSDALRGIGTDALNRLIEAFSRLLLVMSETGALGSVVNTVTQLLEVLIKLFEIPGVGTFLGHMIAFAGTMSVLRIALKPLISIFGPLVGWLARMTGLAGGLGRIIPFFKTFGISAASLKVAFGFLAKAALRFIAAFSLVIGIVVAVWYAFTHWDQIKGWVSTAWNAIVGFFSDLPGIISGGAAWLWGWIREAIPATISALGEWGSSIWGWLSGLPARIGVFIAGASIAFYNWIRETIPPTLARLAEWGEKAASWLWDFIQKLPQRLLDGAEALTDWIVEAIPIAYQKLADLSLAFIEWAAGLAESLIRGAGSLAYSLGAWILEAVPEIVGNLFELGGNILSFLFTDLPVMIFNGTRALVGALVGWIVDAWPTAQGYLSSFASSVWDFIRSLPGRWLGLARTLGRVLWWWITDAGPKVAAALAKFALQVVRFILSLPAKFVTLVARLAGVLVGWIADALPIAARLLGLLVGYIVSFLVGVPALLVILLAKGAMALWGWIVEAVPAVLEALANFGTFIITWLWNFVLSLPGLLWAGAQALWNWIVMAVPIALAFLADFAAKAWNWVTSFVASLPGRIAGAIGAIVGWIGSAAAQVPVLLAAFATNVWNWATNFISQIPTRFAKAISAMAGVGGDMIEGLWNGIQDMTGWIMDLIGGFAAGIIDGVKGFFRIGSPSKVFHEIGQDLDRGLINGILSGVDAVDAAMRKVTDAASPDLNKIGVKYSADVTVSRNTSDNMATGMSLARTPIASGVAAGAYTSTAVLDGSTSVGFNVIVKIGDEELRGIITTEIQDSDEDVSKMLFQKKVVA